MGMTPKMVKFVNEYLIDLNATQAAIRAGYSPDSAGAIGSENLQKPEIQEFMKQRQREIAVFAEMSPEWIIMKLKMIVERSCNPEEILEWDYEAKALVGSGQFKYDSSGANKAIELIGKHLGMFTTKIDLTSKGESMAPKSPTFKLPDGTEVII